MYVIIIKPQHIIINVCPLIWLDQAGGIYIIHVQLHVYNIIILSIYVQLLYMHTRHRQYVLPYT